MMVFSIQTYSSENFFGKKLSNGKSVSLTSAIANFSKYKDQNILLTGKVSKVCVKKGCWLELNDGANEMRITFKDYGFFVPATLQDKVVKVEGQLNMKIESVAEIKHYLEDEGASREQINAVKKPKKIFHFVATGLEKI